MLKSQLPRRNVRAIAAGLFVYAVTANVYGQNVVNYRAIPEPLLFLIREPAVIDALQLSAAKKQQLIEWNERFDGQLLASRNQPPDKSTATTRHVLEKTEVKLDSLLDDEQRRRLRQIMYRLRGIGFVLLPEAVQELQLTEEQRSRLSDVIASSDQELTQLQQRLKEGAITQDKANEQNSQIQQRQQRGVVEILDNDQRQILVSMIGADFNLSQLGRVTFKAPELMGPGPWINSSSMKLSDLRGKVVAVHFYAFQCINCIHNFPWYRQWQDQFADEDFTLIGVHTPETSRERQVDLLRNQVKQDKFRFPVLVDNQQQTWNAWGNSMWPAVYLIDKQGRLRYWWYGELNWKNAGGQKLMGQRIQELLAESE